MSQDTGHADEKRSQRAALRGCHTPSPSALLPAASQPCGHRAAFGLLPPPDYGPIIPKQLREEAGLPHLLPQDGYLVLDAAFLALQRLLGNALDGKELAGRLLFR